MSKVYPIDKTQLNQAQSWMKKHADRGFWLIFRLGIETGLRVTDLTEIEWSDIDFDKRQMTISENKGTRAARTRAIRKAWFGQVRPLLLQHYANDAGKLMQVFTATAVDQLEALTPDELREFAKESVLRSVEKAKVKTRTVSLSKSLCELLTARMERYSHITEQVFGKCTFSANRAKTQSGVISRQSVWRIISRLNDVLGATRRIACHSLRKTFARGLYESAGKDIALVMTVIGHSSQAMTLRYIGISDEDEQNAAGAWLAQLG